MARLWAGKAACSAVVLWMLHSSRATWWLCLTRPSAAASRGEIRCRWLSWSRPLVSPYRWLGPFRSMWLMTWSVARCLLIVSFVVGAMSSADAQQPPATGAPSVSRMQDGASSTAPKPEKTFELLPGEDPQNRLISPFVSHLAGDQKQFWTSPARLRKKDLRWIVPIGGMTAGFIASDSWLSKQVPDKPNQLNRSSKISDYSTYALIGAGGGAFLLGHLTHNDHMSETGLLAGEAAINSTTVTYL